MKFEDSPISKKYNCVKKTLPFGKIYFFEKFVLSEMDYGIHLCWDKILKVVDEVLLHYGSTCKIGYISNKTNSYSYDPNLWKTFYEKYDFIVASSSIYYSKIDYLNATVEKHFSEKSIKRADSIEDALNWIHNLKELQD